MLRVSQALNLLSIFTPKKYRGLKQRESNLQKAVRKVQIKFLVTTVSVSRSANTFRKEAGDNCREDMSSYATCLKIHLLNFQFCAKT